MEVGPINAVLSDDIRICPALRCDQCLRIPLRSCDALVRATAFLWLGFCAIYFLMKINSLHRSLLPILVIVGLVVGSLTTPVSEPMNAVASAISMAVMADDVPCCPDHAPATPDCQKTCPRIATCMAKCFSAGPMLSSVAFLRQPEGDAILPGSDLMGDALTLEPPARPPRT